MSIKERLEDAADRLDDLALSEMLREAIEAIDEAEETALQAENEARAAEQDSAWAKRILSLVKADFAELREIVGLDDTATGPQVIKAAVQRIAGPTPESSLAAAELAA